MQTNQKPVLITAEELAKLLGISTRTLWRLLSSGQLIKPVRFGGNTRWKYKEVMEWLNEGCPQQSQ